MSAYQIQLKLLSDATFGSGQGVAGLLDQEVEHDRDGFPYLRGRTLKGLLSDECDTMLNSLAQVPAAALAARQRLFGMPGSSEQRAALTHVANAELPAAVRQAVQVLPDYPPHAILEALTTIRHSTALDIDGSPEQGSLRSMRVVIRDLVFISPVHFQQPPAAWELALLAASCVALRRLGISRNRGRGSVQCSFWERDDQTGSYQDRTMPYLDHFAALIGG